MVAEIGADFYSLLTLLVAVIGFVAVCAAIVLTLFCGIMASIQWVRDMAEWISWRR